MGVAIPHRFWFDGQNGTVRQTQVRTGTKRINARSFGWLSALLLTALGLWCTLGLLDIVSGSAGVIRVAMLPPWWILAALVVVLGVVGAAAEKAGYDPDVMLPLCAVGILAVPYLPWLPDRLPLLLVLASGVLVSRGRMPWLAGRAVTSPTSMPSSATTAVSSSRRSPR